MSHAVKFEDVTKHYHYGGPRYSSIRHELTQGLRGLGERLRGVSPKPRGAMALDHVSFEVAPGSSYALIGPNGAGKTTALKIISRISYPTAGRVRVAGRVGALIEVGAGIHPELTARENIWFYGQILGMSRSDVRIRFDEIVDFSELGHVLDTPVKMYSTGMQMRLGFSIASHLNPEVFLVDEALAVGDTGFQAKCVERMSKLVKEGRTLLFVSHNLAAVEAVCTRAVFLLNGRVHLEGPVKEVVKGYLDWVDTTHQARLADAFTPPLSRFVTLEKMTCHTPDGREQYAFRTGDDFEVRMHVKTDRPVVRPHFSVGISDGRAGNLVFCSMLVDGGAPDVLDGSAVISCAMQGLPLLPRVYQLWCSIRGEHAFGDLLDWQPVGTFRIAAASGLDGPAANAYASTEGPVQVDHRWKVTKSEPVSS
jgi:ABC-type polysaccharide/polyol phosphate transport system ATPase subunit